MSKSKFGKLLSVVLAVAICCTALCGSIIAVNAANADYNGTYTVTVGDQNNAVPFGSTKVKAQVKFDLPAGFGGGDFTIPTGSDYSSISDAKVIAATPKDSGVSFDAKSSNCFINNGNQVEFLLGDGDLYTSATIEYTYNMSDYVGSAVSTSYPTTITDINLAVEHDYATVYVTAASDTDAYFHSHSAWYGSKTEFTSAEDKHGIITATCNICNKNGVTDCHHTQVQPNYLTFEGATGLNAEYNTAWIGLSGTTVDYNSDGTLNINVHGYSKYYGNTVVILVTDENGKEYYRSSDKQTSTFAGDGFSADEFMVNINNFSAKNIDKKLLITAVALINSGDTKQIAYSRTEEFTLTDYCTDVIDENAVWADGTTDAQKTADKEVAASLLYYGASIDESVFNKTTTAPEDTTIKGTTTVTPVEKRVEAWTQGATDGQGSNNWGFSEPITKGEGTKENPYIIENARQLAGIVLWGGDSTAGKYYEVDENIGAFYLNLNGSNYDASTFETLKSTLSNKAKYWVSNSSYAFQGHFDGNGVEIRGLSAYGESTAGLFPFVKGDVSFKNITVTDSYISATSRVGVIVGAASGDTSLNSISFENCVVKGNYVEMTGTEAKYSHYGVAGGLAGALVTVQESASVNNCLIVDNNFVLSNGRSAYATYGNITRKGVSNGSGGWLWPVQPKYSNIITDELAYAPSNDTYIDGVSNYTNIYTTADVSGYVNAGSLTDANIKVITKSEMQGANALTTMNLSSTDWFATESGYPELRVFHSLQTVSNGNNTGHKLQCAIKVDGVTCTVCGVTESHTMADNSEGTYSICSACGYGEKKITYTTTVTPVEKSSDKWGYRSDLNTADGKWGFSDSNISLLNPDAANSEENPYIIETAEQLAYIALYAGDATAGKYYKVSDNVKEFVLTPSSTATIDNSSFENLKTSLLAAAKYSEYGGGVYKYWTSSNDYAFQGHFDGNGVVIRGLITSENYTNAVALFPYVKGDVSFKNITLTDSFLSTSRNAGGIIGTSATVDGDNWSTITSLEFENCVVKGNYFEMTNTSATVEHNYSVGGLTGAVRCAKNNVTVNNCVVVDNKTEMSNSGTAYAFFGSIAQAGNTTYSFKNSISDLPVWTIANTDIIDKAANYTNVYTTVTIPEGEISGVTDANVKTIEKTSMKGANALTTMNLSSTDWFATESGYPELKVFHSLQNIYTDDLSHTPTCAITINGVACTVCGVAEQHTAGDCSCGYKSKVAPSISELLTQKYDSTVSGKVLTVLNANKTYTNKFESNTKFVSAYTADNNPTDSTSNLYLYTTSLILKTSPYITFSFVLLGDNATNLSNVKIKFTYGETTIEITGDKLIHNEGAGRYYAYRLKELPIVNLKDQVKVTVNDNDFGSYSAAGYAISAINYGSDYFYHAQAAKAIVLYSEMLSARKSVYA